MITNKFLQEESMYIFVNVWGSRILVWLSVSKGETWFFFLPQKPEVCDLKHDNKCTLRIQRQRQKMNKFCVKQQIPSRQSWIKMTLPPVVKHSERVGAICSKLEVLQYICNSWEGAIICNYQMCLHPMLNTKCIQHAKALLNTGQNPIGYAIDITPMV